MKCLIYGAGNLLLSDEGFGVHLIRYLQQHYQFPENVELLDGGTLGMMLLHKFEEADSVYIIDAVSTPGQPGQFFRYDKDDFMLNRIPMKLSPHQAGIQEMLLLSQLRGRCPEKIVLYGIIPASLEAGTQLSPALQEKVPVLAEKLVEEVLYGTVTQR
jgi:hydrogenase maturation protease